MVAGLLIAIAIILIVIVFAGSQVSAFINDTFESLGLQVRESETKIPAPQSGDVVCDMFVTANWEVQLTTEIFTVRPIIFLDPDNVEGVGIDIGYEKCRIVGSTPFSFLTLFDFLGTSNEVAPLDFIIPVQSVFEEPYELSFILVDANTGRERKVFHYQDIKYIVPALQFDYRFEQKLVFRDIVADEYVLKIQPERARFFDHDDGEPFIFKIPDPSI